MLDLSHYPLSWRETAALYHYRTGDYELTEHAIRTIGCAALLKLRMRVEHSLRADEALTERAARRLQQGRRP